MQRLIFKIEEAQSEAHQPKNVHQVLAVRRWHLSLSLWFTQKS